MNAMVVQCQSCLTEFELDPKKVPAAGVRARCSVCSAVITVPPPAVRTPTPVDAWPAVTPSAVPAEPSRSYTPPTPSPAYVEPAPATTRTYTPVEPTPAFAASASPVTSPIAEPRNASFASTAERATPAAMPTVSPSSHVVPPASAVLGSIAASPVPSAPVVSAPDAARRPINPFLTKDPSLRAKRLARALVSDIVAYHPAKHAEGLRDGTLKALFRDEIKKSFEEYIDQVGREFAESTTHFQDALNDVLAGGKKLF